MKENIHFALCKLSIRFLHKIQKCNILLILLTTNLCIVTYVYSYVHEDNGYLQYDHHTINITAYDKLASFRSHFYLPQLMQGTHYTAGLAGAMRVKFLAQGNNNKQHCLGIEPGPPGSHRLIPNHQAAPKLVICLNTISQPSIE